MGREISVKELAKLVDGKIVGDENIVMKSVSSLKDAGAGDVSFLANKKYAAQVQKTKASAVIAGEDFTESPREGQAFILCKNANTAVSKAIDFFAPPAIKFPPAIDPKASVAKSARIGKDVHVGPCAVIDEEAEIGDGSVICAGTYIGHYTRIGSKCLIYPNVSIRERCIIGSRVIIHSGTVIGSDGFGFEAGPMGIQKIPQVGIVQVDDDVEIGGNCTIDRARFGRTWLKRGVKLDNQVHLAHNVVVGEFSMLIGQSGVAGSTEIGRGVIIAAQAGINGHITIGDGARVAGTAGVLKDVPPGESVVGTPAESPRDFLERVTLPGKVKKMRQTIKELEAKIADIQGRAL
ncbi:MAG TPA: UDP-3-O-(3-hydroxymyristoyl)glucosamine N-acyltransferase [Lentisphaeria bacterium]|nr:MAG: UDP-3-O-(3-hydroxymyristoyl)glucosamine N-acyltransferase [Lentisphaerae bacterium GWF2_50_93]HCE47031.1 UDP-3-O-(3-hydroxymyristoyl)glucosamine N-acyltransferase [Lentisphaeria bacterium]